MGKNKLEGFYEYHKTRSNPDDESFTLIFTHESGVQLKLTQRRCGKVLNMLTLCEDVKFTYACAGPLPASGWNTNWKTLNFMGDPHVCPRGEDVSLSVERVGDMHSLM